MLEFTGFLPSISLLFIPLIFFFFINNFFSKKTNDSYKFPRSFPVIGHLIALYQHKGDRFQWLSTLIRNSPSSTFIFHRPFGVRNIITADPAVVEHILKTQFPIYQKGPYQRQILRDLLGDGIFNVDGDDWKFQRHVASYEFSTKSLRKFVETVIDTELSQRLIPILSEAAKTKKVLNLQDILQRFAFDSICKISFGYDPEYLIPTFPQAKFADAFEDATMLSARRFRTQIPIFWKIKRFLNLGSERRLREAILEIRSFANSIVRRKVTATEIETEDLLSRFMKSGHSDEKFIVDIVISFLLAGRDTTSSALTWFFWILHKNKRVEDEILREIKKKEENRSSVFAEVKELTYTHAAITESMRLYPAVPVDTKQAIANDILPGGIPVKKGMWITYHIYTMGRLEKIWGPNWGEYLPERWLQMEKGEWRFMARDPYSYPVFQAGPRICLGKEMAYLQMKRVVTGVLGRFRVVPVAEDGVEPVYVPNLTSKMQGGLMVRIEERNETE